MEEIPALSFLSICNFLMWMFILFSFQFVIFFHVWNKCLTIWNSYILCSVCCFRYSPKLSSKINTEFIFQYSMLIVFSCSSFPPDNYNLILIEWLSCLYAEITCISYVYFRYTSWLHRPMVLCSVSTPIQTIHIFTCTYLELLIFGERSLSED